MYYHLWLIPDPENGKKLKKLVSELSARFQTPRIAPHLSLLIRISGNESELVSKTKELARSLEPVRLRFREIGWMDDFHRCLFLRTEESEALAKARQIASSLFQASENREFIPHVSILYGNIPTETKKLIAIEIQKKIPDYFTFDKLWLVTDTEQKNYWKPVATNGLGKKTRT